MQYLKSHLDLLYARYNHRHYVAPDPLQVVYDYSDPRDQEIVGLIAAALAFGNVQQILKSIGRVLDEMGSNPHHFLLQSTRNSLKLRFRGFQYRYVREQELVAMLEGVTTLLHESGSLAAAFTQAHRPQGAAPSAPVDVLPALETWVNRLLAASGHEKNYLLPAPARGSACKRWHLYLRWMIRYDVVDPGTWQALLGGDVLSTQSLLIPMDTHMFRLARALDMTQRNSANLQAVRDVTMAFRRIAPEDPVRYDFALTRLGIRREADWTISHFVAACQAASRSPTRAALPSMRAKK